MIYSEVILAKSYQVVKRLGPFKTKFEAKEMCYSLSRNLDHDKFLTQYRETGEYLEII